MFESLSLLHAEALHHRSHPVGGREIAHEVVLERDEELRAPRIALTGAATAQLAIGAARLMALGADHEKTTQIRDAFTEFDVGATAGHVGRHGDRAPPAGLRDDLRLLGVKLRVEHGVGDLGALEHARERLRRLHRSGADEARLAPAVRLLDSCDHRIELFATGLEHLVVLIDPAVRPVGRDWQHVEVIDVVELGSLRLGGAGHPRQFLVEAEVILNRDRREGLGLLFNGDSFLGLDRLMEAVGPAASGHFPAGIFVHDDDLVVLDHVLDVLFENAVGLEQLRDVVDLLGLGIHAHLALLLGRGLLIRAEGRVGVDVGVERSEVGQHEGLRVAGRQVLSTQLHQVRIMAFFVDDEVEFLLQCEQFLLLSVLVERQLGLLEQAAHFGFLHEAHQLAVARLAELQLEKRAAGTVLVTGVEQAFRLGRGLVAELGLAFDQLINQRLVFLVLVRALGRRS